MAETKITADDMLSGQIRLRQGGDANDFSVPGSTNYAEEKTDMMKQIGVAISTAFSVTNITFALPFSQKPHVMLTVLGAGIATPQMVSVSTTGFSFQAANILGALIGSTSVNWSAEGRR